MGQTKAKKVLAVGVWNHYLRVASNLRMREEAEARLRAEEEAREEAAQQEEEKEVGEGGRSLRLGKMQSKEELEGWKEHEKIQSERKGERFRDPHGEAMRGLMFGRGEREWLVNAGGPSALDDHKGREIVPKFGDEKTLPRRAAVKTPAEEATSSLLERRKVSPSPSIVGGDKERDVLAEAASRMHASVLQDYTPSAKGEGAIGVFEENQEPLYFSSNSIRKEEGEKKWESPQERAAYAAGLAEERTKRALRLARERLSATASTAGEEKPSKDAHSSATAPFTTSAETQPKPPPTTTTASPNPTPYLTSQPNPLPFFEKSNILLLGPSGSGKTLLLRTLAQALDVPFVHVDATPLTMAGYVGEDVESIIQRLLVEAGWDVGRAQRGIVCIDEIDKLKKSTSGGGGGGKDVGGEGVQQALLRMLEGTTVQISDKSGASKGKEALGGVGTGVGAWYNNRHKRRAGEAMNSAPGGQATTFNVDTSSILFVLSGAFVGIEETIRTRLSSSTPLSQTELLSKLEPSDLERYGLIPEFIGRVPVSVVLNPLTFADMVRVMTEPKNSLVDQYRSLFKLNGMELHMSPGAVEEVVHKAMGTGEEKGGGGGARSLRRIMEETLLDAFYESYGSSSVKYILLDRETVRSGGEVKLFSRGQRFDFEARCRAEAEEYEKKCVGERKDKEKEKEKEGKEGGVKGETKLSAARLKLARAKARRMVRARLRRTNRLVDPVIYI